MPAHDNDEHNGGRWRALMTSALWRGLMPAQNNDDDDGGR